MGLSQGDPDHHKYDEFRPWLLPGLIVILATIFEFFGDAGREILRYDRIAVGNGQLWRLVTGHFTHLGFSHFALNALGLGLIMYLVLAQLTGRQWLLTMIIVIAGIDLGFWLLEPQLLWYVGLSGLLHGFWAAGAIGGLQTGKLETWLLPGILVAKLVYEQLVGPLPGSEDSTGGNVIVAAHLYGAIGGALIAAFYRFRKASPTPI